MKNKRDKIYKILKKESLLEKEEYFDLIQMWWNEVEEKYQNKFEMDWWSYDYTYSQYYIDWLEDKTRLREEKINKVLEINKETPLVRELKDKKLI